jgi:hypothetical protein
MSVEIKLVKSKKDLRKFIYLPEAINAGYSNWLPPIFMDEWGFYQPKSNKSFSYCDTFMALAIKDGKANGRIMGIINRQYNELHNEPYARFYALEAINDKEVLHALLAYAENWAKQSGMTKVIGPLGFSDKDPQGLLIEGFDVPVVFVSPSNQEYLVRLVEAEGYTKFRDLVDYKLEIPKEIPELYRRISARTLANGSYNLHSFKSKRELKPWIKPVFKLINETYKNIYGFVPLSDKEIDELVNKYLPLLDPRFVKVITNKEGETIAFVVAMPDLSEGIKKARGRILPLGIFYILRSAKKTSRLVTMLGAIKEEYRGKGLDTLMGIEIFESAYRAKMQEIDSHLILEVNSRMRSEYERMGAIIHKRFRIFEKDLH